VLGFVLQQVSLGTGKLAPSVATVSVANPVVGILLGTLLLDERLSRPVWHMARLAHGPSGTSSSPASASGSRSPARLSSRSLERGAGSPRYQSAIPRRSR
jgi:hypothetical protein